MVPHISLGSHLLGFSPTNIANKDLPFDPVGNFKILLDTFLGFRDTNMLNHLDKRTEVLIFTGNHIPALPWNVFGIWKVYYYYFN